MPSLPSVATQSRPNGSRAQLSGLPNQPFWPVNGFQVASEWPQLFLNVFQQTGRLIGKILNWFETVHLSDGDTKIARLLIQLLPQERTGDQCEIACSQEELARSFGMGRQALNRRLGELDERGLMSRGFV